MVAITGSSLGYAGSITDVSGKDIWNRIGASKYGVVGAGDLKVSITTGDRMLLVASGIAWGHNIQDTLSTSVTVQLNSVASGSRWDMVVVRRDVTAKTTIEVVQGDASKALPSLTSTSASHPDQPIALCRVDAGKTAVQEIVDLRCWAGPVGLEARDTLVRGYLATPGAEVRIGQAVWRYAAQANDQWAWVDDYGVQIDGLPTTRRPIIKQGRVPLRNPENTKNVTNQHGDGYHYFDVPFPTAMTSCMVMIANDPALWTSTSERFFVNWNEVYSTRSRFSVRLYDKSGNPVGNREGIYVSYIAYGY